MLKRTAIIFVEFIPIYHVDLDPARREKNLKTLRRYLQFLAIFNFDSLVHRKFNPFHPTFKTIAIPQNLLCELINALHIKLYHPSKTQFKTSDINNFLH